MNFVHFSPHFPPAYHQFAVQLNRLGVTVLGIADEAYDQLDPRLQGALREYYRVSSMENYDELLRGLGHFTHQHGKLDRLDSFNEYWLETEARLRTDFNIPGLKNADMPRIKRKSQMKTVFMQAGVPVARGRVVHSLAEALALIDETGYPVVAKPDTGVGAAATYRISSREELEAFFVSKPPVEYIMEEYIDGQIVSFDGLADKDGQIVFCTAHAYSTAVMDILLKDDHIYYHSYRQIPPDLEDAGRRAVRAFDVRERFFHIEFFRLFDSGKIVALEVNMRPPGGLTTDMFNFANDIDIYAGFANLVVNGQFNQPSTRPYVCCYIGRKSHVCYTHSHAEIEQAFKDRLVHYETMSGVFAPLLGSYGYLVRSPDMEDIRAMAAYIQAHA